MEIFHFYMYVVSLTWLLFHANIQGKKDPNYEHASTAVKRQKYAKNKKSTAKIRF